MTNEEARKFAFDSFITAFELGNEHMIAEYFHDDVTCHNHSVQKEFSLQHIKMRLPEVYKKYQELNSEVKDVIVENNSMAFRVVQKSFYVPDDEYISLDIINLYKLVNGKVKEWRLWSSQDVNLSDKGQSNS